jgi:Rrf2 family transcriptional regulator, nitric oxide-sensitive transcriptional repressor
MLSKTAEYALRAAVWLAREPGTTESAERLAAALRMPRRYLHKVLQDLGEAGLVRSQPGPGGGYTLSRDPCTVTILDVINAVDPIERIRGCPLGLRTHTSLCPLHQALDRAYAAVEEAFGKVSLADVLRQPSAIVPLEEITKGRPSTPARQRARPGRRRAAR